MKWLLLGALASLIYSDWALLSLGAGVAASVVLILIHLGLALSLWIRVAELRPRHHIKKCEIVTGSPLLIWYLTKFVGYEIAGLRWGRKLFGGYWIRKRLVHPRDFPAAHSGSAEESSTERGPSKLSSAIKGYSRRVL